MKIEIENRHYLAYYGVVPQDTQSHDAVFKPLILSILESIRSKYSKITAETADVGLIAGLKYLNELNTTGYTVPISKFPNNLELKGRVLKAAVDAIALKLEVARTRILIDNSKLTDTEKEKQAESREKTIALYDAFKEQVAYWTRQGLPTEDALVEAYKGILELYPQPTGKTLVDLMWGIPMEYGIHNRDEVIDAINAHPILPNREPVLGNMVDSLPSFRKAGI